MMNDFFMIAAVAGLVLFAMNTMAWVLSGFDNKYSGKPLLGISILLAAILVGSKISKGGC